MNRRLLARVTVATMLAAGLVSVGPGPASAGERRYVVCAARACLFVLERIHDSDGDGVTDVDEEALGSDPHDPTSTPPSLKLMEAMLDRRLPSFERHLTELVLLPTLMPDGTTIETGLGEFGLRDGDGDLLKSIGITITEIVDRNGFEAVFGLKLRGVKGTGGEKPPAFPFSDPVFVRHVDEAWYSSGTTSGATSLGDNAGKQVRETTMGSGDRPYLKFEPGGVTRVEEKHYTDGSKDVVSTTATKDDGVKQVDTQVTSYDKDGNKTGNAGASGKMWTDKDDGTKHTVVEYDKPIRDGDGNTIGTEHTKVHMEEKTDGSTKITTESQKNYNDGTRETKETVTECKTDCADADEEYQDPDYIGFDIVTAEDWARVEFRIKQIGMPGSGEGGGPPAPEQPPTFEQCTKCGADGTMVLMDPDGVVVVSADGEPNFNKHVQPDYDEWIQIMSGMAGQPVPVTNPGNPPGDPGGGRR